MYAAFFVVNEKLLHLRRAHDAAVMVIAGFLIMLYFISKMFANTKSTK